jgi:hypothetical protein
MVSWTAAPPAASSPRWAGIRAARVAGALYTSTFVLGPSALVFVRGKLFVPGDAAATAGRLAHPGCCVPVRPAAARPPGEISLGLWLLTKGIREIR